MKLTVIGSADAFNSGGRGNSCYVVESAGTGKLMIDFGPTALAGLRRLELSPNELAAIAFTHLHGDHAAGFPFFVIDALYQSLRTNPLHVLGPVLTRKTLEDLLEVTYGDVKSDFARLPVTLEEAEPGDVREVAGFRVTCFAADHMKLPHRPLCLRVEDPRGRVIAFSGDTRLCAGLFAAADGADLLVAECTRLAPPAGHHCTFQEWEEAFDRVRARRLLLTHLGSDVREQVPDLLARTKAPIPLEFAEDGMLIELG
jgi:ribonuclease BN (tRNA processing enzyme)